MEKIKAYHSVKSFLKEDQRNAIAEMLNLSEEDLTRRMNGKEAEYEFLFRSYCLGGIKDIIAFEEGVSRLSKTVATDFLFVLKDGRRLAIEVKSTQKQPWKISKKLLESKKEFANLMNAELYFAIRVHSYWIFLSANYIEANGYKVDYTKDFFYCEFHILGERTFMIFDSFKILSVYTRDVNKAIHEKIGHPEYGYLQKYNVEFNNKKIFKISRNSKDKFKISTILEAIQDSAARNDQKVEKLDSNRTLVIEETPPKATFTLSHLLVAPIFHMINDLDISYDFSTFITEMVDEKDKPTIMPNEVIYVLAKLYKSGVYIGDVRGKDVIKFDASYDISNV
ncbi:hypothetical protein [Bacillus toyonensis]|uniref:hypothetical protein n=1 Tax=Bacillus toyonensis TaxID=155322 RepID=UPI002E1F00E4|nr:hypothetical protein [Bacillus toyonensis]